MANGIIRFDWAIKKLLRDKANYVILEGFLTVVIGEEVFIQEILESESNQETDDDKFNKVDLLVKNSKVEYIIIEVQNNKEYDYFQRMLYGTSKVIAEHMKKGDSYAFVKKVYAITIAYFDLGQGEDYVYQGKTEFRGIHQKDKLQLAAKQIELFNKSHVNQIFPEYWIIKADKFDDRVSDKLDEWIYFLKNSEIPDDFTAPGLEEAREKLREIAMSDQERRRYEAFLKRLMDIASEKFTQAVDFADALKKAKEETKRAEEETRKAKEEVRVAEEEAKKAKEEAKKNIKGEVEKIALALIKKQVPDEIIADTTGLTLEQIQFLKN